MRVSEAADMLGVGQSTLRTWLDRLGINERDSRGHRVIVDSHLPILEATKALLEEGHTLNTVQRRFSSATVTPPEGHGDLAVESPEDDGKAAVGSPEVHGVDVEELADAVAYAIRQENQALTESIKGELRTVADLAKAYAQSAHQIGKLESDNEHLRAEVLKLQSQLTDAQEKVKLLEAPKPKKPFWRIW